MNHESCVWVIRRSSIELFCHTQEQNSPHAQTKIQVERTDNPHLDIGTLLDLAKNNHSKRFNYSGGVLALPSDWFYSISIPTDGLPNSNRYESLLYRMEADLPLPVENLAVDFIEQQGHALGIATEHKLVAPWVEALENHGIMIDYICPEALFYTSILNKASIHKASNNPPAPMIGTGYHVVELEDSLDLMTITHHRLVAWQSFATDANGLTSYLKLQRLQHNQPLPIHLYQQESKSSRDSQIQAIFESPDFIVDQSMITPEELIRHGLKRPEPHLPVNLRRGALSANDSLRQVRTLLRLAVACVLLLFVTIACGLIYQTKQVQSQANIYAENISSLYIQTTGELYAPPPGIAKFKLKSEHDKLMAIAGRGSDIPIQSTALLQWYELTRRLPTHFRYRILEVRIDPQRIHIEGQARSHGDADRLAAALRSQQGFSIESPHTEKLKGKGVSFSLFGEVISSPQLDRLAQSMEEKP